MLAVWPWHSGRLSTQSQADFEVEDGGGDERNEVKQQHVATEDEDVFVGRDAEGANSEDGETFMEPNDS